MKKVMLSLTPVLLFATMAFAQPKGGLCPHCPMGGGGHGPMHFGKGLKGIAWCVLNNPEIGLSEQQKKAIFSLRDNFFKEMSLHRQKIRALHKEFLETLADPKASAKDIKAKASAIEEERRVFTEKKVEMMLKVRDLLTSEQLSKIPNVCALPPDPPMPPEE